VFSLHQSGSAASEGSSERRLVEQTVSISIAGADSA
jgi:hypothetical protein